MTDQSPPSRSERGDEPRAAGHEQTDVATPADDIIDVEISPERPSPPPPSPRPSRLPALAAIVLSIGALVVSAVVWQRMEALRLDATQSQQQAARDGALARKAMEQFDAQAQARQADGQRLTALGHELHALQQRQAGIDQAFQLLVDRGSDHMLLNDVEHLALIAQQQLRLGGHVSNAIISLETAQAQLVRAGRPQFALLLQAVNGDLDRLRAAAPIDVQALSARLDRLERLLADAPQLLPERSTTTPGSLTLSPPAARDTAPAASGDTPASDPAQPWWEQAWGTTAQWAGDAWSSVRQDLGSFVSVRRVDDATALLMSPDQTERLRDQLRLRVLTARLALLTNQPAVWKTELEAIARAVALRFDMQSTVARQAEQLVLTLAETSIDAQLPSVEHTLQVVQQLRAETESDGGDAQAEAQVDAQADPSASFENGAPEPADASAGPAQTPASAPAEAVEPPAAAAPAEPSSSDRGAAVSALTIRGA